MNVKYCTTNRDKTTPKRNGKGFLFQEMLSKSIRCGNEKCAGLQHFKYVLW